METVKLTNIVMFLHCPTKYLTDELVKMYI